jgi:hypothetical protein
VVVGYQTRRKGVKVSTALEETQAKGGYQISHNWHVSCCLRRRTRPSFSPISSSKEEGAVPNREAMYSTIHRKRILARKNSAARAESQTHQWQTETASVTKVERWTLQATVILDTNGDPSSVKLNGNARGVSSY